MNYYNYHIQANIESFEIMSLNSFFFFQLDPLTGAIEIIWNRVKESNCVTFLQRFVSLTWQKGYMAYILYISVVEITVGNQ